MDLTTRIEKAELERKFGKVLASQVRSISPDDESKKQGISKQVEVEVDFEGASLAQVLQRAFGAVVIAWANGPGRKGFKDLPKKVTVKFIAPAQRVLSRDEILAKGLNEYRSMTKEERAAYIKQLEATE